MPIFTDVAAATDTYGKAELCGAPATTTGYRNIGYIHSASIVGAPAGSTVRYQLVDREGGRYPADGEPALTLMVPPAAKAASAAGCYTRPRSGLFSAV